MRTLNFTLRNGMDSMVRVMSLLRRKGFDIKQIRLSENMLEFEIAEEFSMTVLNNVSKLADVTYIAA
ncbi:ACT domain-containing protein [Peptoanaerobacter stomatis]|uniref:ACT domain-containing protein n=1 Tax=Peptoanaerobacter stomatis TaxID=796937 RepID=UPI003F9FC99F